MPELLELVATGYLSWGVGTAGAHFHGMFRGIIPQRWHPQTFWRVGLRLAYCIVLWPHYMHWIRSGRPWQ